MKIKSVNFRNHIMGFLISFVIFSLLNILFKDIQFLEGYVDFRISGIFTVMSGLLFGFSGALGCAVGNLVTDLFGTFNIASPFGALSSFLFAYLPYRLWHTVFPVNNHRVRYISSTNTLIKYIIITAFSVMASTAVLSAGCDLLGVVYFSDFFMSAILSNLYFALFWGTTVFMITEKLMKAGPHIPYKLYICEYNHKKYMPDYIVGVVICVLVFVRCIEAFWPVNSSIFVNVINVLIIACALFFVVTPMYREKNQDNDQDNVRTVSYEKNRGLGSQIITGFFVFISISTAIFLVMLVYDIFTLQKLHQSFDLLKMTLYILQQVNICGFIFIAVLIFILKWIENRVTKPITKIAEVSGEFVENGLQAEMPDLSKASCEVSALAESFDKMSSDIIAYIKKVEEQAKKEESIRLTLELAAKIQLGILPAPLIDDKFELSAYIHPAKTVGGDFYDYIKLDDDRLLVCVADVSSKGMPAAMFMAEASILVKCLTKLSPEKILYSVNNHLCETNSENMFVTMFVGIIDRKRKVFQFANAGHNFPIFWKEGKAQWLKTKTDLVLGFFEDREYHLHSIDIDDSFQLFLYTDGINEAEDINQNFFGNERLEELCMTLDIKNSDTNTQLDIIKSSLKSFTKDAPQSDDITALMIKVI